MAQYDLDVGDGKAKRPPVAKGRSPSRSPAKPKRATSTATKFTSLARQGGHTTATPTFAQELRTASQLMGVVRHRLAPAYRRAIDALDPGAAVELAGSIMDIVRVLHEFQRDLARIESPNVRVLVATALGGEEPSGELVTTLAREIPTLEAELARELGPQTFRGKPVMGEVVAPPLEADPLAYLAGEATSTIQLVAIVDQIMQVAGGAAGASPLLDADQRASIARLVEPWRGRPIDFEFLATALDQAGIWNAISGEVGGVTGKTLEQLRAEVAQQAQETGPLADVGDLTVATLHDWFDATVLPSGTVDDLAYTPMRPVVMSKDRAWDIFWRIAHTEPFSRASLIRELADMGLLGTLCANIPWKYLEVLHDELAPFDREAATLLEPYYVNEGGGESAHQFYMDEAAADKGAGNTWRARGWNALDWVHNFATIGFERRYSAAYDAYQQGLLTRTDLDVSGAKAAALSALVLGATALTGGAASGFVGGAGAGYGIPAAGLLADVAGGAVAGVTAEGVTDAFDRLLDGKRGPFELGDYAKSAAVGGLIGAALGGLSIGAGKYFDDGGRPIDTFAGRYPELANVLERIRGSVVEAARGRAITIRLKASELLELVSSRFALLPRYAFAGGLDDLASLDPNAEMDVAVRPIRSLSEPMQMSTTGDGGNSDGGKGATPDTSPADRPKEPLISIDSVRAAIPEKLPPVNAPPERVGLHMAHIEGESGLIAELYADGTLRLYIKSGESDVSGGAMFSEAMYVFKDKVRAIRGQWEPIEGLRDNFDAYKQAISEQVSPEEAARGRTFTGHMAGEFGFTRVRIVLDTNAKVVVDFLKP